MNAYLYVYMTLPRYMTGKLYWRIKKNGKWTWKAVFPNGKPDNLTEFLEVIFTGGSE